jgi:hypothetical protein
MAIFGKKFTFHGERRILVGTLADGEPEDRITAR